MILWALAVAAAVPLASAQLSAGMYSLSCFNGDQKLAITTTPSSSTSSLVVTR
jgi:hypothetical protein